MVSDGIKIPFVIDLFNRTGSTDSNTVRAGADMHAEHVVRSWTAAAHQRVRSGDLAGNWPGFASAHRRETHVR
jgi:hypothetical protein